MMTVTYIPPRFTSHESYEELAGHTVYSDFTLDGKTSSTFEFDKFYQTHKAFILAEPGYGKSRVIQEIIAQAKLNNKKAACIALNQLGSYELADLEKEVQTGSKDGTKRSEGFDLYDSADIILCLDALDEVDNFRFVTALNLVANLTNRYPAISVYVGCRTHYVADKRYDFNQFSDFKFIKVNSLDSRRIRDLLNEALHEVPDRELIIDNVVGRSYGYDQASVFSVPRYLLAFVKAVRTKKFTVEELQRLRKVDIFEVAIYEKLENDTEKPNENTIIKRVLEKLALVMEISQTNQITREELVTFLDRVQSNVNQALFSVCSIDKFVERVLKKTGETLELENTEFQEYLAAKELLRLGERDQILYDLIVEPTFLHLYSNWYDVLRYAIEIDPKTILPVVSFIEQKSGRLVENKYFDLLNIVDVPKLSPEEKQRIFETFYQHFQRSPEYIGYRAETISRFYLPVNYISCLAEEPYGVELRVRNQIAIIRALAEADQLDVEQQSVWKQRLVNQAKRNGKELQMLSVSALGYFKDVEPLRQLKKAIFDTNDYDLQNEYLRACAQADADHEFSLEILIEGFHRKRRYADTYAQKIQKPSSLHFILDEFIKDVALFESYYTGENSYNSFQNFVYRLNEDDLKENRNEAVKKLKTLLKKLLPSDSVAPRFRHYLYDALLNIAEGIIRYESRFLFTFIDWLPERFSPNKIEILFAKNLQAEQVKRFIEKLKPIDGGNWIIERTFRSSPLADEDAISTISTLWHTPNPQRKAVREKINKFYDNFYEKLRDTSAQDMYAEENEANLYKQFQWQLGTTTDRQYQLEVFSTFLHNRTIIEKRATGEEIDRLRFLVEDIFQHTSIENYQVRLTRVSDSSKSWNLNDPKIDRYVEVLRTAQFLEIDQEVIRDHRDKLLCFLPLAKSQDGMVFLLDCLQMLSDTDQKTLVEFYKNRDDDAIAWAGSNFTQMVADLKLTALIPTLKRLYDSTADKHLKEEILRYIGTTFIQQEKKFLNDVFEKHESGSKEEKNRATIANSYLISHLKDTSAIRWRFEQLKDRKAKFQYPRSEHSGVRGVSKLEVELDQLNFAKHLIDLNDLAFAGQFNNLLKFSFDIKNDVEYEAYSNYLQKIVYQFYASFTKLPMYSLKELRKQINKYPQKDVADSFGRYLRDLEIKYAGEQKKTIHQSANLYNQLQARIYEPIHHPIELLHTILDVVRNEVTEEIQQGGLYAPIKKLVNGKIKKEKDPDVNEDLIQKMLKLSLENNLQKRGFRGTDIHREVELYNSKRYDFLIKYGFVGPIVIEIKLEDNPEITNKAKRSAYKMKMQQYLQASSTKLGLYLVFKVKSSNINYFEGLRVDYQDIEGLYFEQIDCTKSFAK